MMRIALTLACLFGLSVTYAQFETSYWISESLSFDFRSFPPSTSNLKGITRFSPSRTSISDSEGNLLFYCDGLNYFDKRNQLMPNGKGTEPSYQTGILPHITVPVPGHKDQYYVFISNLPNDPDANIFAGQIAYSIVDMTLNDGLGDVTEKNKVLGSFITPSCTVIKEPGTTDEFWLITTGFQGEENTLHAFRINANGIASDPVNSELIFPFTDFLMKVSPDGKLLVLRAFDYSKGKHTTAIYDFDHQRGKFQLKRSIETPLSTQRTFPLTDMILSAPEFSPDSRFLYCMQDSIIMQSFEKFQIYKSLLCYDLHTSNEQAFLNSKLYVHRFASTYQFPSAPLQLSPQNKIIMVDGIDAESLHVIHNPSACGKSEKDFEPDFMKLPERTIYSPPIFPHWYFYKKYEREQLLLAGDDKELCSNESVVLGTLERTDITYQWEEAEYVNNSRVANPLFTSLRVNHLKPDSVIMRLKVFDQDQCASADSVIVVVNPVHDYTIKGAASVCPGAENIIYAIKENWDGEILTWEVNGGAIAYENENNIQVNWNGPNTQAVVSAYSKNKNGCSDNITPLAVTVFKTLKTQTPQGIDTLQCKVFTELYSIDQTNGSNYTWHVEAGTITQGQGSNEVTISWDENSPIGKVWIDESVNTALEVCFGQSDTLHILNPARIGSENVHLNNISGIPEDNETLVFEFNIDNPLFYQQIFQLQKRTPGEVEWTEVASTKKEHTSGTATNQHLDKFAYEYRLRGFNSCMDSVFSNVHKNILLSAEPYDADNFTQLRWNGYSGWNGSEPQYQLFKKIDDTSEYLRHGSTTGTELRSEENTDGFTHHYYVEASSTNDKYKSLSNKVIVNFDHPVFLPNVITPNDDLKNDFWVPSLLHLYHENKLVIYNRYGESIYESENYTGNWAGEGLPAGIYYYEFRLKKGTQFLKGIIHLIK